MATRLIIDGNAVYEIDEDCLECQKKRGEYRGRVRQQNRRCRAGSLGKEQETGQDKSGRL